MSLESWNKAKINKALIDDLFDAIKQAKQQNPGVPYETLLRLQIRSDTPLNGVPDEALKAFNKALEIVLYDQFAALMNKVQQKVDAYFEAQGASALAEVEALRDEILNYGN